MKTTIISTLLLLSFLIPLSSTYAQSKPILIETESLQSGTYYFKLVISPTNEISFIQFEPYVFNPDKPNPPNPPDNPNPNPDPPNDEFKTNLEKTLPDNTIATELIAIATIYDQTLTLPVTTSQQLVFSTDTIWNATVPDKFSSTKEFIDANTPDNDSLNAYKTYWKKVSKTCKELSNSLPAVPTITTSLPTTTTTNTQINYQPVRQRPRRWFSGRIDTGDLSRMR